LLLHLDLEKGLLNYGVGLWTVQQGHRGLVVILG
jgi:hypothetical protein